MSKPKPPPLAAMASRKRALEALRTEVYARLRAALEAADGVVSRAALEVWPELAPKAARNKGNRYVRRFKLVEFAAALRIAATGQALGRQDR